MIEALDFIRINVGLGVGVADVAKRVGLSRQWLERLFKKERGRAVSDEIRRVRLKTAVQMVAETDLPFGEIGVRCGFVDGNRLGVIFQKRFGTSPSEFRAQTRQNVGSADAILADWDD